MAGQMITNLGAVVIMKHKADVILAKDGNGLQLQDDGGNLGVFVEDGGQVGIGNSSPSEALDVTGNIKVSGGIAAEENAAVSWAATSTAANMLGTKNNITSLFLNSTGYNNYHAGLAIEGQALGGPLSRTTIVDICAYGIYFASSGYGGTLTFSTTYHDVKTEWMRIGDLGQISINDSGINANMTIGLTINQGAADNEILAFKSSDVAHALVSRAETDTYAFFGKAAQNSGGLEIGVLADDVAATGILLFDARGGTATTTTGASALGLVNFYIAEHDGAGNTANLTADGIILSIKGFTAGGWYCKWHIDEDGDTWQSGGAILGGVLDLNSTLDLDVTSGSYAAAIDNSNAAGYGLQVITSGHNSDVYRTLSLQASGTTIFVALASGQMMINDTVANANMTIGLTIAQAGNDDEILAFKSSDIAHGCTTIAETDTYAYIKKVSGATGGIVLAGLGESQHAVWIDAIYTTDNTTKSAAGEAPIVLNAYLIDGTGTTSPGADANLVAIQKAGSSVWICDEDGDTWQSGGVTSSNHMFFAGAYAIYTYTGATPTYKNIVYVDNTNVYYIGHVDHDKIILQCTNNLYFGDSVNTKMSKGLTINQGAADNEILAFKSSDVAHDMTSIAEADTYGLIKKVIADSGGIYLIGLSEANMAFYAHGLATTDNTTKGTAAAAPITLAVGKISGTAYGDPGADANLVVIKKNSAVVWHVDEDGDTWQSGGVDCVSLTIDTGQTVKWGVDDYIYGNVASRVSIVTGGVEWYYFNRTGTFYINDNSNANMTIGLTINQGANDNEILAFKSSDVNHLMSDYAEADTYGAFLKYAGADGGLVVSGYCDNIIALQMLARCNADNTTKSAAAAAPLMLTAQLRSGSGVGNVGADANILAVRNNATTVLLLDEDGDLYIGGNLYSLGDVDTYIALPGSDVMTLYTGGNAALSIDAAGQVTKPLQPAFSATMAANQNNIVAGGARTIIFDSEIFDLNADFNPATYTFTAPVTGKYHLSAMLRVDQVDTAADYYYMSIVTSNRTYTKWLDPNYGADLLYFTLDLSVIADMDAADTAYVTIFQSGGANQADIIASSSFFMGYLLG
jgi:hypothetical protein